MLSLFEYRVIDRTRMFHFGVRIIHYLHRPQGDRVWLIPQLLEQVLSFLITNVLICDWILLDESEEGLTLFGFAEDTVVSAG